MYMHMFDLYKFLKFIHVDLHIYNDYDHMEHNYIHVAK